MTNPQGAPLLNSTDLASFQASDPDWFLAAAGDTIRNFCQWHIFPSLTDTVECPVNPDGTIMLPSLYVTGVQSITLDGCLLDPTTYQWHQAGFIRRYKRPYFQWPLWPLDSSHALREYPSPLARFAEVSFTHGYPVIPPTVNAVGMELANTALELPSGVAKQIASGPYSIGLKDLGVVLTDEQRRRLGPFKLVRF